MIILDSSAWIEYFTGTKNADFVEETLEKGNIITPSIVLVELSCKATKEKWDFQEQLTFIKSRSTIMGMNEKMILKCGKVYIEERKKKTKFGMADAIILTTAKEINAKILTKDNDFRGLDDVIMLD